ncbi:MAG: hypothetical protein LBE37_03475 [Sphingobacterium sp.]|jgi:TfoX/Sxy family transcriptional regulator of competence genes|nr:hypothetical protein [Sphingobacterium sp.]
MTTKKFAKQFEQLCRTIINISLEPIFGEYIITQHGKRIGVLYENRLYLLSTENLKKMFAGAVEENPFGWAYYRLILIEDIEDIELLKKAIAHVYHDLYYHTEFVTDISYLFKANRSYPDSIVKIYNLHITFLRFCYENKLLKLNPLDKQGRILHLNFENNDLTEMGAEVFHELYHKWLVYTDKNDEKSDERNNNVKMLEKYYSKICKEKGH